MSVIYHVNYILHIYLSLSLYIYIHTYALQFYDYQHDLLINEKHFNRKEGIEKENS